jgi:cyclophilin family peptidyl-prolyl cis-trans isomerase
VNEMNFKSWGLTALILLCLSFVAVPAIAQDEPVVEPVAEPTQEPVVEPVQEPVAEPGEKDAAFQVVFEKWVDMLQELVTLKNEYVDPNTSRERREEIEALYAPLIETGNEMKDELIVAATAAFIEAPRANEDVEHFLIDILQWQVGRDDCENAHALAKLLIDNEVAEDFPPLYGWAGKMALYVNEFDDAEEWLTLCPEGTQLHDQGMTEADFLGDVSKRRATWEAESEIRAAEAEADDLPRVLLETSAGNITIELFENEAPNTVANMISLVESKFYDDVVFHRVLPDFMAQGGDPTGTGGGGPDYCIPCECLQSGYRKHFRGSLSMAHAGPNTGGSQFFLTFVPTEFLDGRHTVFGRVLEGYDVLADINRRDPDSPTAGAPSRIIKATVIRKRDHEYAPETLPSR